MTRRFPILVLILLASLLVWMPGGRWPSVAAQSPPDAALPDLPDLKLPGLESPELAAGLEEDAEALLRGPLHEAFAGPIPLDPQATEIVPKMPPEPIEEIPPEAKPEGENAIWIPGYWDWDEERDDFLWISGVWRIPPADRRWVPGYWTAVEGGYQWISGFWAPLEEAEVRYLPTPPATLEAGPTSPQPTINHYWVSGCWLYRDTAYAWRPGYWHTYHDGWVWVPAHYAWTPRGVVFVAGYWDYPLARRGLLFAPVCFRRPVYLRHGYYYSPRVVVDIPRLALHLFVYPRRSHYYWGDYYGFRPRGGHAFVPWYTYHGRHGYDPVFAYYSVNYRRMNIDYTQRLRGWHDYFQRHEQYRPARTLQAQVQLAARVRDREPELRYALLGDTMSQALARKDAALRLERISDANRHAWKGLSSQMHQVSRQRIELESGPRGRPEVGGPPRPEAGGRPSIARPETPLKLPELPQIARVKGPPGAPKRLDDFGRTDSPGDFRGSRGPDGRERADVGRSLSQDPRPGGPDRSRGGPPDARGGPETARSGQPDRGPPSSERPRIEIPGSRSGSEATRGRAPEARTPDVRTPSTERPRIEIPGPRSGSEATRGRPPEARTPDVRTPSSERPRIESPGPRSGSEATRGRPPEIRTPDVRTPSTERPRIESPGSRSGSEATRGRPPEIRTPDVRTPSTERPRIEIPGSRSSFEAMRSRAPEIRTPDVRGPSALRPPIELPAPRPGADASRARFSEPRPNPGPQPRMGSSGAPAPRVELSRPSPATVRAPSPPSQVPRSVARPSFDLSRPTPSLDRSRSSGSFSSGNRPEFSRPQAAPAPSSRDRSGGANRGSGGGDRSRGRGR